MGADEVFKDGFTPINTRVLAFILITSIILIHILMTIIILI
jgi:hypothetical protein